MGSFDGVCGLSNMAIGDGSPVVTMMIRNNPWPSYTISPIYPYDVWQPASVLVRGTYADYGNVEIGEAGKAAWGLTQEAAKRWYKRTWFPAGESHGREYPGSWRFAPTKLEQSFDCSGERPDMREDCEDEGDDGSGPKFSIWMAHAGIFDHLVNNVECEWFNNGVYSSRDKTIKFIADHAVENGRKIMDGEVPGEYDKLYADIATSFRDKSEAVELKSILRMSRNPWKSGQSSEVSPVGSYLEEAIYDAHDTGDRSLYEALVGHFHTSQMLNTLMYQMRRSLAPPGTIGPQHGHDQPFLILADAVRDQAAVNKARYDIDYDEDYDDEEPAA